MTRDSLPSLALWLLNRIVPADWRDSISGDLLEESRRRRARGRSAGTLWALVAVLITGLRLTRARRRAMRDLPSEPVTRRSPVESVAADFKQAARGLRAHRSYAAAAVATLAIGLGVNAAVFNMANWLLLRPLPGVTDEAQLVSVGFGTAEGVRVSISVADTQTVATASPAVTGLAGYQITPAHIAAASRPARRVTAEVVSGQYFDILALAMTSGRGFTAGEGSDPGHSPVAVISHRLWRQEFASAADVVGGTIVVNRQTVTIVGVAARGFHGPSLTGDTDLWMPIAQHRVMLPGYGHDLLKNRRASLFMGLIGRLAPGATSAMANAQIEAARAAIAAANPTDSRLQRLRFFVTPGAESQAWQRGEISQMFVMLSGMVAILLMLTGANVGNLIIGRTSARNAEITTRLALGASRWAIVRLLLAESVLLSTMAGVVAVGFAWLAASLVQGVTLMPRMAPLERAELDWRVLGYALVASTALALIAGTYPGWAAARMDLNGALRASGRSETASRQHFRRVLAIVQVAMSVALLVGAALFTHSMALRLSIDPGFDTSRVLTLSVAPGLQDYGRTRPSFYGDLVDRARQIPGVRAAGVAWLRPSFQGVGSDTSFRPEGASDDVIDTDSNIVSPGFFDAVGQPIIEGRDFSDAEFRAPAIEGRAVVLMTASLARRAFPDGSAVGRTILLSGENTRYTIIGVVRDARQRGVTRPSTDMLYLPFPASSRMGWSSLVVGLDAPDHVIAARLRQVVANLDPTLPTYDVMRVDEAIKAEFALPALVMRLTITFATLATLVAAVGLYGVLARAVAERRREFSIRVALGATGAEVGRLVARESAMVLVLGVIVGGGASTWLARYLSSQLYGISRIDPLSFAAAILIAAIVMLFATWPAGRRAARLDPAEVLRTS